MASLKALIAEQSVNIEQVRRALPNLKKMGVKNYTISKLQHRLDILEKLWEKCQTIHVTIDYAASDAEVQTLAYFTTREFLLAEEAYLEASDYMADQIGELKDVNRPADQLHADGSTLNATIATHSAPQLTRIDIPEFSGNRLEWENFRDVYDTLIKNNPSLSNVTRLHYLKTKVKGEAAGLLRNVRITETNFDIAWKILTDEYENKRLIINSHLQSIIDLPILKAETASSLRNLRDVTNSAVEALANLNRPVDSWDDILVFLLTKKLASRTRQEWSMRLGNSYEPPTYKAFVAFISTRIRGLDDDTMSNPTDGQSTKNRNSNAKVHSANGSQSDKRDKCPACADNHLLFRCKQFIQLNADQRFAFVKKLKCCVNCLRISHSIKACTNQSRCFKCDKPHHTSLHRDGKVNDVKIINPVDNSGTAVELNNNAGTSVNTATSLTSQRCKSVLLATAWVILRTSEGRRVRARALLDQGSTHSFISETLAQNLHTIRQRTSLPVSCFGVQYSGTAKSKLNLFLESCDSKETSFPIEAYIFNRITSYGLSKRCAVSTWPHLSGLALADPDPTDRTPIHILIGADLYGATLLEGLRQGTFGSPTAQLTIFGWIVTGPIQERDSQASVCIASVNNCDSNLDSLLTRFWETEEIPSQPRLTDDEKRCETHFRETHSRVASGRYVVRLPFKQSPPPIGDSLPIASRFYEKLEKRLLQNPKLSDEYHSFLKEYCDLGHMELVPPMESVHAKPYYFPHHPVVREGSATTKIRVVFNASCATSNRTSLNDHLFIGPKLQADLPSILIKWRRHKFVYIADIAKMFRQILIHPEDIDYQRILWRPSPTSPVNSYRLRTVTYGTAPAPYLSIRVLQQLAEDEGDNFPLARSILQHNTYVDDVLFGANDIETARTSRNQLNSLLEAGGFHLRKWAANSKELLLDIPKGDHELAIELPLKEDESIKVLGIAWSPHSDSFKFRAASPDLSTITKRTVLSAIARLFDPLGWATPVIIKAKILMQDLWIRKCDWDENLPDDLRERWESYYNSLPTLNNVRIPRWTGQSFNVTTTEVHGFADASSTAIGAVVYLRLTFSNETTDVKIIAAKSKVAPIKTLSIPRLELNAALLLVNLLEFVVSTMHLEDVPVHCWTDSTVVLDWTKKHPSTWGTFVANRISKIQTQLPSAKWRHVPTAENPADCASRGIAPPELELHHLWWTGPSWLRQSPSSWPSQNKDFREINSDHDDDLLSEKRKATVNQIDISLHSLPLNDLPNKISSWTRLLRITAYVIRFTKLIRSKARSVTSNEKFLSSTEINEARLFWCRSAQFDQFSNETTALSKNLPISPKSPLLKLTPFLDKEGTMRLGGRLKNSLLAFSEKHPIIMPRHRISTLIAEYSHKQALHGGPQLTLRVVRQHYWIIGARNLVKTIIHKCIPCARERASIPSQLMGDLPRARVSPSRPFLHTGVDYAGPFSVLPRTGRGQKSYKCYVAVFVCLSIRAIHLELVSDYSSASFLASFKRFTARRGIPSDLYSDNGTNFQGAAKELSSTFRNLTKNADLMSRLATDGTSWHFIPPAAPHFGGIWEAGVKSMKHHLRRVIGSHTLSIEEFTTLLCQVEACLNSRPISPLTNDPNDFAVLTPGHFLIGAPYVTVPDESALDLNESRLSRYQRVRAMLEHFWIAWSRDYLHSLQQRQKWTRVSPELKTGEIILLRNNLLPPSKWDLAKIIETFPGKDGHVRTVTVKTAKSTFTRPINQICRLPLDDKN